MKKFLKQFLFLFALIFVLVLPYFIFAVPNANSSDFNPLDKLEQVGTEEGPFAADIDATSFAFYLGWFVAAILSFLGIIFIGLMIYAGYNWMTAGGEEEKVNKAKSTIKNSIVGLVIVLSAYIIWNFIFERLFL